MRPLTKNRIESLDFLKGLVMVIMALDHVRDFFHASAFLFDPGDPTQSTLPIFFTRWITHFCAPIFSFTAGISAWLVGKKKTKHELAAFLFKRGLWLIFVEVVIDSFAWTFDIQFRSIPLGPIWALGISMVFLAGLVYLPVSYILVFSLLLIFGHNLLDQPQFSGLLPIIHEQHIYILFGDTKVLLGYPIVPWIAIMSLGYCVGRYFEQSIDPSTRKRRFNIIGASSIALFLVLRFTNVYGDPTDFKRYGSLSQDLISFFNPTKYPPSLSFVLMTLGAAFLFLANAEKLKGRVVDFFSTFGRVPFFYYILHLYLIHLLAMLFAQLSGFGWKKMILSNLVFMEPGMKGYGFSLWVVYAVWVAVILLLYPLCRYFDAYKRRNKDKWWLSYL